MMRAIDYLNLLADGPRVRAFQDAIRRTCGPDTVALDLGTGLGTYALFAARAGARVYAVEVDPIIELARVWAAENGLADRITFLPGLLQDLDPPEPMDVLIFEDYAPFLCQSETAALLDHVARRWMRSGAIAIPRRLRLMAAPVACPETRATLFPDVRRFGLSVDALAETVVNDLHTAAWSPEAVMADPCELTSVNPFRSDGFLFDRELTWRIERPGPIDGLGLWLDLELADGVDFSNRPGGRSTGWNQVFLPARSPVRPGPDATVRARIATLGDLEAGGPFWWKWWLEVAGQRQEMDTFRGAPLSLRRLQQASPSSQPALTRRGRVRRALLELVARDDRTVGAVAAELRQRLPDLLPTDAAAYRAIAAELESGALRRADGDRAAGLGSVAPDAAAGARVPVNRGLGER